MKEKIFSENFSYDGQETFNFLLFQDFSELLYEKKERFARWSFSNDQTWEMGASMKY